MGFFSWNCKVCELAILSPYDLPDGLKWMNEAVALLDGGTKLIGDYDGYGRINGLDFGTDEPAMYHQECFDNHEYDGESDSADCQGFFWNVCNLLESFRGKIPWEIKDKCKEEEDW